MFFDIGGRLAPISIRDQMVRARIAIDRALQEKLIGPRRPLLVIGAGAAGATASIRAAAHGVPTLLIEAAGAPFLRQAGCRTRWVDPVQYDWPLHHWSAGIYPWTTPAMPLPWVAGPANWIALGWAVALQRALWRNPTLHVMYRAVLAGSPTLSTSNLLQVQITDRRWGVALYLNVGMVLSCVGAGTERSSLGNYRGFNFWATDPFQRLVATDRVLISGGGDGALQDYLRVVTGRSSAKAIYASLGIPPDVEHLLQSAEDQATRLYIWGADGRHDHAPLLSLHQTHQRVVDRLLPSSASSPVPNLCTTLANLTANAPSAVKLMYPCTHFSRCYGLNRFLVLLLATYLERHAKRSTLLPQLSLAGVAGVAGPFTHRCFGLPSVCHGRPHVVTPAKDPDCRISPSVLRQVDVPLPGDFNVVIVRHGIAPPPPLTAGLQKIVQARQALPYHVAS